MTGFKKQKIIGNLVTLEKQLILNDDFLELSLTLNIFFQRMLEDVIRNDSPSPDYCMKVLRRGRDAFTQFIDILIERKQNDIVFLFLNTT